MFWKQNKSRKVVQCMILREILVSIDIPPKLAVILKEVINIVNLIKVNPLSDRNFVCLLIYCPRWKATMRVFTLTLCLYRFLEIVYYRCIGFCVVIMTKNRLFYIVVYGRFFIFLVNVWLPPLPLISLLWCRGNAISTINIFYIFIDLINVQLIVSLDILFFNFTFSFWFFILFCSETYHFILNYFILSVKTIVFRLLISLS